MKFDITKIFKTEDNNQDNFLSRVFGIFSEDIVRIWCKNPQSQYTDLGRPSLYDKEDKYTKTTLDFCLKNNDEDIFIAEQKSELAYQDYKYIELNSIDQLKHHDKAAFTKFLETAKDPRTYDVKIDGKKYAIKGSILIWGCVNNEEKEKIKKGFSLHDILSLEDIINNLITWKDKNYKTYIENRKKWINELMSNLNP